jgi:hypothetical protein
MAYGVIVANREMSDDSAQQVFEHVRSTGPVPPEGCRLMLAGPADPGTRIVSVWDSQEALQRSSPSDSDPLMRRPASRSTASRGHRSRCTRSSPAI